MTDPLLLAVVVAAQIVVNECDYEYGTAQAMPSTVALDNLRAALLALEAEG